MKKILMSLSVFAFLLMGSCSSDDNSGMFGNSKKTELPGEGNGDGSGGEVPGDNEGEEEESNLLVGKWKPSNVKVTAMGNEMANLPYPHKAGCDEDFLVFAKTMDATFTSHDDACKASSQTEKWSQDKDMLKFNLLGSNIEVKVIENTATTLVISGNGKQFESLIPIFLPDANIPPFLLATAVIEMTFKK